MREKPKYETIETDTFKEWHKNITDRISHQIITAQIVKLANGNFGNVKSLKGGLCEAKIKKGGFRLYFINREGKIIILLCGGDKLTQQSDIINARKMAKEI